MPLTDAAARNAKPAAKTVRIFDRDGLYLEVSPRGGKCLKKARARTIDARQLLDAGVDPSENRRAAKAAQVDGAAKPSLPAAPNTIRPAICAAPSPRCKTYALCRHNRSQARGCADARDRWLRGIV